MGKKVQAFDLIQKIEKLARQRIAEKEVVTLDDFRSLKKKLDPYVILVIDDDTAIHQVFSRVLKSEDGYDIRFAHDGTELSHILDQITPDLIFMDINLPWINGYELTELMKSHRGMKSIPIIMISGHSSEEDIKKAFESGADDFLIKPFGIDHLLEMVAKHIKKT